MLCLISGWVSAQKLLSTSGDVPLFHLNTRFFVATNTTAQIPTPHQKHLGCVATTVWKYSLVSHLQTLKRSRKPTSLARNHHIPNESQSLFIHRVSNGDVESQIRAL